MARKKGRKMYHKIYTARYRAKKKEKGICIYSGCHVLARPDRRMCADHAAHTNAEILRRKRARANGRPHEAASA